MTEDGRKYCVSSSLDPSGLVVSGLGKLRLCEQLAGMAFAPPKCPMNMEMVTSSQPIYARSGPLSKRTAQALLHLISPQGDTARVPIRERRGRMSSRILKRERRGGSNSCCRNLEKETRRSLASSRDRLNRAEPEGQLNSLALLP